MVFRLSVESKKDTSAASEYSGFFLTFVVRPELSEFTIFLPLYNAILSACGRLYLWIVRLAPFPSMVSQITGSFIVFLRLTDWVTVDLTLMPSVCD